MSKPENPDRELQRQQWLLGALRGASNPQAQALWLAGSPVQQQRGLHVYRANAAANAERALAAAYPTVRQLLGPEAFATMARLHWQVDPPVRGDLADWGSALPGFIATDPQLAGEPYLADLARLEWALHLAEQAEGNAMGVIGLQQLGSADPDRLRLQLRPGHAVLVSPHPVHTLWAAHRTTAPDRFAMARQALAQQRAEAVRVERQGLVALAVCMDLATAGFEQLLLQEQSLASALSAADPAFAFEPWLIDTLRRDALAAVLTLPD